jgi:DNA-binding response OmpR family regulator
VSAEILIYGRNSLLLNPRRLILEAKGYRVFVATSLTDALRIILFQDITLVVWCSSALRRERENGMTVLNALKPELMNIVLAPGLSGKAGRGADRVLDSCRGPEGLLTAIEAMLDERA